MARRSRAFGIESSAELARKFAVLEQELAVQRAAIQRLTDGSVKADAGAPADADRSPVHAGAPRLHAIRP